MAVCTDLSLCIRPLQLSLKDSGVLESGSDLLSVDLIGCSNDMIRMPIGSLSIQLKIVHTNEQKTVFCDRAVINKLVSDKQMEKKETLRKFQIYLKHWWTEFLQIRPDHEVEM